ncbi:MAG: hypothetical protein IPN27_01260 [Cellvibrionales bacterium]|nr:hypothetical protein [Cellvibrionales bacterium]
MKTGNRIIRPAISSVLTVSVSLFSLSGCVTNNFPGSHTLKADKFRQALNTGDTKPSLDFLAAKKDSEDKMLYMMERGRILNLQNQYPPSLQDLNIVINQFEANDRKALISAGAATDSVQATLYNDTSIEYRGYGYERIFTHVLQAFNYLGQNKRDDAMVEVRKIALEEKELTDAHEKEIAKTAQTAKSKNINTNLLEQKFSGIDLIAGKAKSSFSSAYAHYLSGVLMESTGKPADRDFALTSYKLAYEIHPESTLIASDIARLSEPTASETNSRKKTRKTQDEDVVDTANAGNLVVLYEDNFVAQRTGITIPIPTPQGGAVAVAFPMYTAASIPRVNNLRVTGSGVALQTTELTNVSALAAKSLKEEVPAMIVRAVIRVTAKYALQYQAEKELGGAGALVAGLYNVLSEQADLRTWLTLPNSCQVARTTVASGKQTLTLQSGSLTTTATVDIQPGKTTLVRVANVGQRMLISTFQL